jgi:hypothetical protein
MTPSEFKAIKEIYDSFEKRKAAKRVNLSVLLYGTTKKWYQFWKI